MIVGKMLLGYGETERKKDGFIEEKKTIALNALKSSQWKRERKRSETILQLVRHALGPEAWRG